MYELSHFVARVFTPEMQEWKTKIYTIWLPFSPGFSISCIYFFALHILHHKDSRNMPEQKISHLCYYLPIYSHVVKTAHQGSVVAKRSEKLIYSEVENTIIANTNFTNCSCGSLWSSFEPWQDTGARYIFRTWYGFVLCIPQAYNAVPCCRYEEASVPLDQTWRLVQAYFQHILLFSKSPEGRVTAFLAFAPLAGCRLVQVLQ